MAEPKFANENEISRDRLAELLNEDLSREYQAIIACAAGPDLGGSIAGMAANVSRVY